MCLLASYALVLPFRQRQLDLSIPYTRPWDTSFPLPLCAFWLCPIWLSLWHTHQYPLQTPALPGRGVYVDHYALPCWAPGPALNGSTPMPLAPRYLSGLGGMTLCRWWGVGMVSATPANKSTHGTFLPPYLRGSIDRHALPCAPRSCTALDGDGYTAMPPGRAHSLLDTMWCTTMP